MLINMYNEPGTLPLYIVILLLILDVSVSLAISIPLVGVLVRYRAHYSPKAVQLGAEEGVPARTGPTIGGYFSTFKRVYKLEGWAGLYKGTMPTLLTTPLMLLIFPAIHIVYKTSWADIQNLNELIVHLTFSVISLIISIPFTIISYRAIVTPVRLPYFGLRQSLRILLTPTERARPWTLYFTPGLVVANLLKIIIAIPLLRFRPLQRFIVPHVPKTRDDIDVHFFLRSIAFTLLIILATSLLVPLEIIATRLATQRNHASQVYDSQEDSATADVEVVAPVYCAEEDVIGLRDESDPYTSFRDCVKRMAAEEGRATFFRAWWISFIPLLAAGILQATAVPKASIHIQM